MKKEHIKYYAIGIVILIAGYGGFVLYVSLPITFGNVDKAGTFGDSFGVLTALFSGLAFAGIIYTITQQSELLEMQKEDLELTRDEL
ncbi:MAG: hypothetical protein COW05_02600 [Gammaproteobacteria bacterium CG12_big_fil_rev_8_21_14_0_65_46_12]|nr:MAG: hypothetical protein COW05_02600 [Gammaproteobacteria bacterium CG12_big_fil_rev_8_21_14_0_65_46_12]